MNVNNGTSFGQIKVVALKGEKGDMGDAGDYAGLINKPSINNVILNGNKSANQLGLANQAEVDQLISQVGTGGVTELWSGHLDALNEQAELSQSVDNFDYIDIYYKPISGEWYEGMIQSCRIPVDSFDQPIQLSITNSKSVSVLSELRNDVIELTLGGNDNDVITLTNGIRWSWSGLADNAASSGDAVNVEVFKIEGITLIDGGDSTSEVQNIRIGADGTTYASAGDAVRGQVSDLDSKIDDVEADLKEDSNYAEIIGFPSPSRYYYKTSGTTFDVDTDTIINTVNKWMSRIIPCKAGDEFIISGSGGNDPRLYAFVDNSGNIITKANANVTLNGAKIIAPANSSMIIINNQEAISTSYKVIDFNNVTGKIKAEIQGARKVINPVIMNASMIGSAGTTPALYYEFGTRTFGFHIKDGCTYHIEITDNSTVKIGFVRDNIDIVPSKANGETIYFDGFMDESENSFDLNPYGFATCFIYVSRDINDYNAKIKIIESTDTNKYIKDETNTIASIDQSIYKSNLFGGSQFYLSEATADSETYITTMTIAELYAFYDDLCLRYPKLIQRANDIGMDASNTYEIREYIVKFKNPIICRGEIASGDIDVDTITNLWDSEYNNNIFALSSGIHGNEKAGAYGLALAIEEILNSNDQFATFIKSNFELHIVPCVNPYGFQNSTRNNSNNVDINRDFFGFTQAETIAFKNWIDNISNRTVALIDSHGTTGYYPFFEVVNNDRFYMGICNLCMRFITAIQNNWKQFYASHGLDKYPYCYIVQSTYSGTKATYLSNIGVLGITTETPQYFIHGDEVSWNSDLQSCKFTKDMIINLIQSFGEWGSRIKKHDCDYLTIDA